MLILWLKNKKTKKTKKNKKNLREMRRGVLGGNVDKYV
jgi:hypothetical protein